MAFLTSCGGSPQDNPQAVQRGQSSPRSEKTVAANYQTAVEALYIAYFGRPADAGGLNNFENALMAAGAPTDVTQLLGVYSSNPAVKSLIDSFGQSAESQTLYKGSDTNAFVTAVFQHVLGRAPLPAGLSYWSNAISSGSATQGNAALAIMVGALTNTTPQGLLDAKLIDNRLDAAGYFTANMTLPLDLQSYTGSTAAQAARAMLATIAASTAQINYYAAVNTAILTLQENAPWYGTPLLSGSTAKGLYFSPGMLQATFPAGEPTDVYEIVTASNASEFDTSKTIYAVIVESGTPVFNPGLITINAMSPSSVLAKLRPSATLATGLYQGTLQVNLCSDQQCNSPFPGSPWALPYSVNVLPGKFTLSVYPATQSDSYAVNLQTTQGSSLTTSQLGGSTPINAMSIYPNFSSPLTFTVTVDVPWLTIIDQTVQSYPEYAFTIPNLSTFAAGTYSANVTVTSNTGQVAVVPITLNVARSMDGTGTAASFRSPIKMAFDSAGNMLVVDRSGTVEGLDLLRKVTPDAVVTTVVDQTGKITAGNTLLSGSAGSNTSQLLPQPLMNITDIALDASGNLYFNINPNSGSSPSPLYELSNGRFGYAITGVPGPYNYNSGAFTIDATGNIYYVTGGFQIVKKAPSQDAAIFVGSNQGSIDGTGTRAAFNGISALATDSAGNLYVLDVFSVRKVTPAGVVTTLVSNIFDHSFSRYVGYPSGMAVDGSGNVFVSVPINNNIFKITPDGTVTNYAGTIGIPGSANGSVATATFNYPNDLAFDKAGNLYVVDTSNVQIRKISPSGTVTTFAGGGGSFAEPVGTAGHAVPRTVARGARRQGMK